MRVRAAFLGLSVLAAGFAAGCGDDEVGATAGGDSASGTDTDVSGTDPTVDTNSDPTADTDSGDSVGETESGGGCVDDLDCDDDNPCTTDVCNPDGTCGHEAGAITTECRPQIDVEYPPRAATIEAASADEIVTIVGTAQSLSGAIATLTINGDDVSVGGDGSFSHDYDPKFGGNTLVLETTDASGQTRKRVQSFLFSTSYSKPTTPITEPAIEGLGIYLSQEVLDDGDRSEPYDDLASLIGLALASFDVSSFFDASTPLASQLGYDIYLTDLRLGGTAVVLTGIDGGLHMQASLLDVDGDLNFDCTTAGCVLLGGDGTGGLDVESVVIEADVILGVDQEAHELDITLENVTTNVNNLDIYSNNVWTNFLLTLAESFIISGVVSDLETELNGQLEGVLGPLLEEGLSAFSLSTSLEFPNLADADSPIGIDLITDFQDTDFHDGSSPPNPSPPQGGVIALRGGGYVVDDVISIDNLGIPDRNGCGELDRSEIAMARADLMEIGLHDDLLNQLLYGAWRGGLLDFPLPEDLLGGGDDAIYSDLDVKITGQLAPTASNCNPRSKLLAHLGDVEIEASLTLFDQPVSFTAYSSMEIEVELIADDAGIGIALTNIDNVETELSVNEDMAISSEPTLISVLETALVDNLIGQLGDGALGGIELPEIDLSESLGLPPGTAVVAIQIDGVGRNEGTTVVRGHL